MIVFSEGRSWSEVFELYAVVGELSLEGKTRPVKGALSMAMVATKQAGIAGIVVSAESAHEAAVVEDIQVIAVDSLAQAVAFVAGQLDLEPTPSRLQILFEEHSRYEDDLAEVRGQEAAKRALTIAAAGTHNLQTLGPLTSPAAR